MSQRRFNMLFFLSLCGMLCVWNEASAQSKRTSAVNKSESDHQHQTDSMGTAWSLQQCITYALQHNLDLSENVLNERLAALRYEQSKASRIPTFNADFSGGNSYGRSIDPTSNQFVNQGFFFNNMSLNSQVLVFGWFQKKNEILQNDFAARAAKELYAQLGDNIALNVANTYLRILLAQEQLKVAEEVIQTDLAQLKRTQLFVASGSLPQLNIEQMLAQVASDSSAFINAKTEEQLAILEMRALLNLDFYTPFAIETPNLQTNQLALSDQIPEPADLYEVAQQQQHRLKAQLYNVLSAQKGVLQAKALRYPSLFLGGNLSTSYSSQFKEVTGQTIVGQRTLGNVEVAGTQYPITTPEYDFTSRTIPYGLQLDNNLRSNIALTLSIPIFNGWQVKTGVQQAQIQLYNQEIAMDRAKQQLQQDVHTAVLQARAAQQQYSAAISAERAAGRALEFAIKRYNIGMLSTFEYTQTQNNYNQASYRALAAKYEMIFKMKVLDFYQGQSIKL